MRNIEFDGTVKQTEHAMKQIRVVPMLNIEAKSPETLRINESVIAQNVHARGEQERAGRRVLGQELVTYQQGRDVSAEQDSTQLAKTARCVVEAAEMLLLRELMSPLIGQIGPAHILGQLALLECAARVAVPKHRVVHLVAGQVVQEVLEIFLVYVAQHSPGQTGLVRGQSEVEHLEQRID